MSITPTRRAYALWSTQLLTEKCPIEDSRTCAITSCGLGQGARKLKISIYITHKSDVDG